MKKKIIIQLGTKKKVFKINSLNYEELIQIIEYYGASYKQKDNFFVYENPRIFNIVDLYLSGFATPEPLMYDVA